MAINTQTFVNLDILRARLDDSHRILEALFAYDRPSIVRYVDALKALIEINNNCITEEINAILDEIAYVIMSA